MSYGLRCPHIPPCCMENNGPCWVQQQSSGGIIGLAHAMNNALNMNYDGSSCGDFCNYTSPMGNIISQPPAGPVFQPAVQMVQQPNMFMQQPGMVMQPQQLMMHQVQQPQMMPLQQQPQQFVQQQIQQQPLPTAPSMPSASPAFANMNVSLTNTMSGMPAMAHQQPMKPGTMVQPLPQLQQPGQPQQPMMQPGMTPTMCLSPLQQQPGMLTPQQLQQQLQYGYFFNISVTTPHKVNNTGDGEHTEYTVSVQTNLPQYVEAGMGNFMTEVRFSRFHSFYQRLNDKYYSNTKENKAAKRPPLPSPFPSSTFFHRFDASVIEERRAFFDKFLKTVAMDPEIRVSRLFCEFLGVNLSNVH